MLLVFFYCVKKRMKDWVIAHGESCNYPRLCKAARCTKTSRFYENSFENKENYKKSLPRVLLNIRKTQKKIKKGLVVVYL